MSRRPIEGGLGGIVNGRYILGKTFNAIEDVILRHDGVERCCVVPHGTMKKGRHLHALILAKPGVVADEAMMIELRDKVRAEDFEDYEVPTRWRAVRFLPEAPKRETVRGWLKLRSSFSKLYYPGRQAPLRGEKDWEGTYSLHLEDALNSFHFEGALNMVKFTKFYGEKSVVFDLKHRKRRPGVKSKGGKSFRQFCARFYSRDPLIMGRIERAARGSHIVVRAQAVGLQAAGGREKTLLAVMEALELEVRSDFVRTNLDATDAVFERAL